MSKSTTKSSTSTSRGITSGRRRKIIGALILISFLIPVVHPLGLPMRIDQKTLDFWNEIQKLQPGDVVDFVYATGVGAVIGGRDLYKAVIYSIADRGAKIIVHPMDWPDAADGAYMIFQMLNLEERYGYKYGEDYVIFPFIAGEETAMAAVRDNMHIIEKDYFGNPTSELKIMENVHTLKDVDLIVYYYSSSTFPIKFIRQWPMQVVDEGVRCIDATLYVNIAAWYGTYVHGCLDLTRGYAEFQRLSGYIGEHVIMLEARNTMGFFVVGLLVYGAVSSLLPGKKEKR